MASNTKGIIDMEGLYRAGYGSVYDPRLDKQYQNEFINMIMLQAGKWVVDGWRENHKSLKKLKSLGRKSATAAQMEINGLGGKLNPQIQESLYQFKKEYDKGARMQAKGWSRKKKDQGQMMMDLAMEKMTTLNQHLSNVEETMAVMQDSGLLESGENPVHKTGAPGWNSGARDPEITNATRLATGELLDNLYVNNATGEIIFQQQKQVDISQEKYDSYINELGSEGVEDKDIPSFEEWSVQQEPEVEDILFSKIDFPQPEDGSIIKSYNALLTTSHNGGKAGNEFDDQTKNLMEMELFEQFSNAKEGAVRSMFFGGKIVIVDPITNSLTKVIPAHKYLID